MTGLYPLHRHLACAICGASPALLKDGATVCLTHASPTPQRSEDARLWIATALLQEMLSDWERAGTIRVWTEASVRHFLSAEKALTQMSTR